MKIKIIMSSKYNPLGELRILFETKKKKKRKKKKSHNSCRVLTQFLCSNCLPLIEMEIILKKGVLKKYFITFATQFFFF